MIQSLHRGKHSHTLGNVKEHEGSPACQTNGRKSGPYHGMEPTPAGQTCLVRLFHARRRYQETPYTPWGEIQGNGVCP